MYILICNLYLCSIKVLSLSLSLSLYVFQYSPNVSKMMFNHDCIESHGCLLAVMHYDNFFVPFQALQRNEMPF